MRLEDLQMLASAAETRAFQFSGALILLATLGTSLADNFSNLITLRVSLLCVIFSAALSFISAFPRKFHIRGHYWRDWKGHVDDSDEFVATLVSQAEENDLRIDFNELALERAATNFTLGFLIALLGFGVLIFGEVLGG